MTTPASAHPLLLSTSASGAYTIERSLRFNSADSAYLSRTPASAGNRKTWTWSGWVKRSKLGTAQNLLWVEDGFDDITGLFFNASDNLSILVDPPTATPTYTTTAAVYRDCSAWYHIVVACDTTQSTSSNRIKLYVNGVEQTVTGSYPNQDVDTYINSTTAHGIGIRLFNSSSLLDAYLAECYLIDGQALDPTSFGEFDATTGVWNPIAYTGSYPGNSFHLDFADNSSAAALGYDAAGSNDWTVNNLSVTAGAGNDSLRDYPTNGDTANDTGLGGQVQGNYCTWNPLDNGGIDLSNGNLDVSNGAAHEAVRTTIRLPESGKWYAECVLNNFTTAGNVFAFGIDYSGATTPSGWNSTGHIYIGVNSTNLLINLNASDVLNTSATTTGAVLQVAYDADADKLWLGFNNVWRDSAYGTTGNPSTGTNPTSTTVTEGFLAGNFYNATGSLNTGQRPWAYTAPSGFKALCTANLPTPTIEDPSTVMDVALYQGNGTSQTISGLGFSPDFAWFKGRSAAENHVLSDTVRGTDRQLFSNLTNGEQTNSTYVTSFTSDGFSLGSNTGTGGNNINGTTYVAWAWDAGSSTVSNTDGSITSSVRANASSGFSVVTYPGALSGAGSSTIGHGLGVAPSLVIVKNRSAGENWVVYHQSLGNAAYLILNGTNAQTTGSSIWGSTSPTSAVFTAGYSSQANLSGNNYVAYCFAPVASYSAMGSYVGNGSSDGPFVYTGFRPRWVMIKKSSAGSAVGWYIYDSSRDTYNLTKNFLAANSSAAEVAAGDGIDILSNGFKLRATGTDINDSSQTFVWAAFAESPFAYARAR